MSFYGDENVGLDKCIDATHMSMMSETREFLIIYNATQVKLMRKSELLTRF